MVVRFLPLAVIQSPCALVCATVVKASTRTASRFPEIKVEDVGDHLACAVPGGRSPVTTGMPWMTKTFQRNVNLRVPRLAIGPLLAIGPFPFSRPVFMITTATNGASSNQRLKVEEGSEGLCCERDQGEDGR